MNIEAQREGDREQGRGRERRVRVKTFPNDQGKITP